MRSKITLAIIVLILTLGSAAKIQAETPPWPLPPVAAIAARPIYVFTGETVYFDGLSSYDFDGEIVTYSWNFGDSQTGSGLYVTHSYSTIGDKTVSLTVYDNDNLSDTATVTIHVRVMDSNTIYVDKNATGSNNGQSWTNAYTELRSALTGLGVARQIYVAKGAYTPSSSDESVSFVLQPCTKIYGGFPTGGCSFENRDPVANPTILSGLISETQNSYRILTANDCTTIEGLIFEDANGVGTSNYGGGIYSGTSLYVYINKCIFRNNKSYYGGGICSYRSRVNISDCVFSDNTAQQYGGGLMIYSFIGPWNKVEVVNSVFTDNEAHEGGGIECSNVDLTITNCTFFNNRAEQYGGGLFNAFWGDDYATTYIKNCIFWENEDAGGQDSSAQIHNSPIGYLFVTNSCVQGGWSGYGNKSSNPYFNNSNLPAGGDGIFLTYDDGLRLDANSPCIDSGNGSAAQSLDILGLARVDIPSVTNTGTGTPNYSDMGSYEYYKGIDSDGDGMDDDFEDLFGLDKNNSNDAALDKDNDGLSNLEEFVLGSRPDKSDSDISLPTICSTIFGNLQALGLALSFCRGTEERHSISVLQIKSYVFCRVQNTDKSATHLVVFGPNLAIAYLHILI